jgi:hypothetical protein
MLNKLMLYDVMFYSGMSTVVSKALYAWRHIQQKVVRATRGLRYPWLLMTDSSKIICFRTKR